MKIGFNLLAWTTDLTDARMATLEALKANGNDGWLTIKNFGHAQPDIAAATRFCRPVFESYEEAWSEGIALIREGWAKAG